MNFAYDLIIELARGFLAASDTRAQDCSAYAIQEMLQVYQCGSKESTSRWEVFVLTSKVPFLECNETKIYSCSDRLNILSNLAQNSSCGLVWHLIWHDLMRCFFVSKQSRNLRRTSNLSSILSGNFNVGSTQNRVKCTLNRTKYS